MKKLIFYIIVVIIFCFSCETKKSSYEKLDIERSKRLTTVSMIDKIDTTQCYYLSYKWNELTNKPYSPKYVYIWDNQTLVHEAYVTNGYKGSLLN